MSTKEEFLTRIAEIKRKRLEQQKETSHTEPPEKKDELQNWTEISFYRLIMKNDLLVERLEAIIREMEEIQSEFVKLEKKYEQLDHSRRAILGALDCIQIMRNDFIVDDKGNVHPRPFESAEMKESSKEDDDDATKKSIPEEKSEKDEDSRLSVD
jgi:hypothetical protein